MEDASEYCIEEYAINEEDWIIIADQAVHFQQDLISIKTTYIKFPLLLLLLIEFYTVSFAQKKKALTLMKIERNKKINILKPQKFTFKKGIANLFQFSSCSKTNNQTA